MGILNVVSVSAALQRDGLPDTTVLRQICIYASLHACKHVRMYACMQVCAHTWMNGQLDKQGKHVPFIS